MASSAEFVLASGLFSCHAGMDGKESICFSMIPLFLSTDCSLALWGKGLSSRSLSLSLVA